MVQFYSELTEGIQEKMSKVPNKLLAKQPKTTAPKPHATYPTTLNCQTSLKKLLKRFYLASIPVKPLENF